MVDIVPVVAAKSLYKNQPAGIVIHDTTTPNSIFQVYLCYISFSPFNNYCNTICIYYVCSSTMPKEHSAILLSTCFFKM